MIFWLLLISIFIVILIITYSSVPWVERKVLFYPSKKTLWKPDIPHESMYINVHDPSKNYNHRAHADKHRDFIHSWYFNNFPGKKTVLYCHGNSGNISHRSYIVDICQKFEMNLFIFDYRGFGRSSGRPCKKNLKQDSEAAYKYLTKRQKIDPKDLVIWGESLGGYVAMWTAAKYKCSCLILLSTFSGLDDAISYYCSNGIIKSVAGAYSGLVGLRYNQMKARNYIKKVKCPTVIMHSKEDDIIPYKCAKILYKSVTHGDKKFIDINGYHSSPIIKTHEIYELFNFCGIDIPDFSDSGDLKYMLKNLETVNEKIYQVLHNPESLKIRK